jgi:hypothetical protein
MILFSGVFIVLALSLDHLGIHVISAIMFTVACLISFFSAQLEDHLNLQREVNESLKKLMEFTPRWDWIFESKNELRTRKNISKESETLV